jgi:hypothetical protein
MTGGGRRNVLNALAGQLDGDAIGAADASRVRAMSEAVRALASETM